MIKYFYFHFENVWVLLYSCGYAMVKDKIHFLCIYLCVSTALSKNFKTYVYFQSISPKLLIDVYSYTRLLGV